MCDLVNWLRGGAVGNKAMTGGGVRRRSPLFPKDVYSVVLVSLANPTPIPTCLTLASLAFSFACANREAVNGL